MSMSSIDALGWMVRVLEVVAPVRQVYQIRREVLQKPLVVLDLLNANPLHHTKDVSALL
jgi:hypothetical protein